MCREVKCFNAIAGGSTIGSLVKSSSYLICWTTRVHANARRKSNVAVNTQHIKKHNFSNQLLVSVEQILKVCLQLGKMVFVWF
jgi:hypothetical protein